jgi:hypothetical protein
MGQIIIDIPVNENLHFGVESKQEYEALINLLERFRSNENLTEDEEDAYDLACVERAKKDIAEYGTIPWESAKEMLESV